MYYMYQVNDWYMYVFTSEWRESQKPPPPLFNQSFNNNNNNNIYLKSNIQYIEIRVQWTINNNIQLQ